VNHSGKLFCSGDYPYGRLLIYNREDLSHFSSTALDMDCGLFLKDDNHLVSVTTHLDPATMSYFTFDDAGNFVSRKDDPYNWDYEMLENPMAVSDKYIVTSTEGFIYRADESLTYVNKITAPGNNQADFEFGPDGSTVYSAVTNQRSVFKTVIGSDNTVSSTQLSTTGYPWKMARKDNTLVILSSPVSFSIYNTTNAVIVEKIGL
jgi:hypothetical protein